MQDFRSCCVLNIAVSQSHQYEMSHLAALHKGGRITAEMGLEHVSKEL